MSQIQEIKQATDIVQLISERRQLARAGTNWKGTCPFHSEKSPSFFVNEQLQRYKCFGCGESGDAFTFLEKYEGMTFAEALQYLADRAGITLEKTSFSSEDDRRQTLLEILNLAKEYYHFLLTQHKLGEPARQYLKDRGVTAESIKVFQLGYALPGWDGLLKYLHGKKKYTLEDIEAAGLIISKNKGNGYDRFRERLMFPLTDHRGRVVGFSGRLLSANPKEAKYINTPETQLYHKGEMLFGYSQLYQSLRKANEAIVVEGEFDVISSAQAHVNHVVAVKGSALTEDHMRLLSRTVQKVILAFDMDKAGIAATQRAIEVAKPFGIEVRVIEMTQTEPGKEPVKQDPDDLARTNPAKWREMVKSSVSVYDFFLSAALHRHNPKTPEGQRQIIDELAPIFGQITHAVELEFYIKKLAKSLDVSETVIRQDLERFKTAKRRGVTLTTTAKPKSAAEKDKQLPSRKAKLEDYVMFLLFNSPEEKVQQRAEKLKHMTCERPGAKQLIAAVLALTPPYSTTKLNATIGEDLQQTLLEIMLAPEYLKMLPDIDPEKEWTKSVEELIKLDIAEEVQKIERELEATTDEVKQAELLRKVVQLSARSKK